MPKPILYLDFDGVIHSYTSGWKGADVIPDPPVPGAMQFILDAQKIFTVVIFSSRSHQSGGQAAMQKWLSDWTREWASENPDRWSSSVTSAGGFSSGHSIAASISCRQSLDDRAITFTGIWPDVDTLRNYKPWNKK